MTRDRFPGNLAGVCQDAHPNQPMTARERQLDLLAFGVVALVVAAAWAPTLSSGQALNPDEDFLLHAARHEAVRKSLIEHHTFPLRSHWFGGGFPTLGEPEDPALNPLVLLSVLFGSLMGPKLIAFAAALASGLGTYGLCRYILDYTRWGALFSALAVGMSLYVVDCMCSGSLTDVCPAYLPLCLLLIGLSCRGRRTALFVLPFVLYTMLSDGKQAFFTAMLCVGMLCLLDALPMFKTLSRPVTGRKFDARPLQVLGLALAATFLVGMVRILPVLEFVSAKGGLTHLQLPFHAYLDRAVGPTWQQVVGSASGLRGPLGPLPFVGALTIGWLPIVLFVIAAPCFWRRSLPWVIAVVLFTWLVFADKAPLDLYQLLLARLPVFSTVMVPYKYFAFQVVLALGVGAGQFFWLLRKLPRRWLEHLCAAVLVGVAVGFLYPKTAVLQRYTYTGEVPAWAHAQQEEFFNVAGLGLPRKRTAPPLAVAYVNVLRNIGTVDWYSAIPIAENAVPRYFVTPDGSYVPNEQYRREAFFVESSSAADASSSPLSGPAPAAQSSLERTAPAQYAAHAIFHPNRITVEVTVSKPAVVVINQNYHPAWSADRGELFDRDGLLAVRLRETGSYAVHLRYLPRSFVIGLAITIVSFAAWVAGFCVCRGGRAELTLWRRLSQSLSRPFRRRGGDF